jgi:hypothetical protein
MRIEAAETATMPTRSTMLEVIRTGFQPCTDTRARWDSAYLYVEFCVEGPLIKDVQRHVGAGLRVWCLTEEATQAKPCDRGENRTIGLERRDSIRIVVRANQSRFNNSCLDVSERVSSPASHD